jgi:hypothetical protein
VLPRCASFPTNPLTLTGVGAVTGAASHEMAEAATDPYPQSNTPAYAQIDINHIYWMRVLGGGEVGDMCAQFDNAFFNSSEVNQPVQRIWSNKSALAGHDPCQPALPGSVYFNAAPVQSDMLTVSGGGQMFSFPGVKIAAGMSKTIPVQLWSDGPVTQPWTVTFKDTNALLTKTAPYLSFTSDKTSGLNGDVIMLTITVMTASTKGREGFIVESTSADGKQKNLWLGEVGQM